jgi:SAM-dependent methyltransferase/gas vesicle protein
VYKDIKKWLKTKLRNALGLSIVEDNIHKLGERSEEILKTLNDEIPKMVEQILQEINQEIPALREEILHQTSQINQEIPALREEILHQTNQTNQDFFAVREEILHQINQINQGIPAVREKILHQINHVNHNLSLQLQETQRLKELYYRDLMLVLDRLAQFIPTSFVELETEHLIALHSNDHKFPRGTANDNTRSPRFVQACEALFNRPLNFLDLGCSGGGLILDFTLRGHKAIGLEGSDFSLLAQRAEWRLLPNNLFTCDLTKPFILRDKATAEVMKFDVISAWEFLEHIAKDDLPQLFENILLHLSDDGIFVGSIATFIDSEPETGAVYHVTVESRDWWQERFCQLGMQFVDNHPFNFYDFCRGTGNGPMDWDATERPDYGFHFVARKSSH